MTTALLFPGQGSQAVGMGADLLQHFPDCVEPVFAQADALLGPLDDGRPFRAVFLEGPDDLLKQTRYTQPALLTVSIAALRVLQSQSDLQPVAVAGHSLGEFSALVAAEVIPFESALSLVKLRAELMQRADRGAMAAVLGLSSDRVLEALAQIDINAIGPVVLANDNSAEQQVISGTSLAVEAAMVLLKSAGAKRVVPLPVGGAFHSPLMAEAGRIFADALARTPFDPAKMPVVLNVDATPEKEGLAIRDKLSRQMVSAVQWRRTMDILVTHLNLTRVIELGSGAVLTGLMKRAYPEVALLNLNSSESCQKMLSALGDAKTLAIV